MRAANLGDVSEHLEPVGGLPIFWHERPARTAVPVLYVHGVPTSADDFEPFLARTGGLALDLPGFGRSGKPAEFPYSLEGYADFLATFLDHAGLERLSLVVHDWGAAALVLAQREPERIERLVIIDALPLLGDYRPHRLARIWGTRGLGELLMGLSSRRSVGLLSRGAAAGGRPMPAWLADRAWAHFDHGTQRAILKLYRSTGPEGLARAGARLSELSCPALVIWGAEDPYVPASFADAYARALGGQTRVEVLERASHWPWIDRPEAVGTVADFLLAASPRRPAG